MQTAASASCFHCNLREFYFFCKETFYFHPQRLQLPLATHIFPPTATTNVFLAHLLYRSKSFLIFIFFDSYALLERCFYLVYFNLPIFPLLERVYTTARAARTEHHRPTPSHFLRNSFTKADSLSACNAIFATPDAMLTCKHVLHLFSIPLFLVLIEFVPPQHNILCVDTNHFSAAHQSLCR